MMITARTLVVVVLVGAPFSVAVGQGRSGTPTLSLLDAVRRGLSYDPALGVAAAGRDAASASVGEAVASWFPTLVATASLTRYEEPMIVSPIHAFQPGLTPPFDRTLFQGGAVLSYTLFDGGARGGRVRLARQQAAVAEASFDDAEQLVMARVVSTYLAVLSGHRVLESHDRRLAALAAERSRVRQRREAGTAADVDVLRVDAVLAGAEAERVELAQVLDLAERDLARLVGAPVEATRAERLQVVAWVDTTMPDPEVVRSRVIESSPVLERARREAEASRAGQALARSARWPKLAAAGAWLDRGSVHGDHTLEWNVGVQFTYALFTGGAVRQSIRRADANRRVADERLRLAERQVTQEVDRARSMVEEAGAQVASLRTAVARFTEVVRIERLRLEAGVGTEIDYLSAEAELLAASAGLVQAQYSEMVARVEFARIGGQLDLAWLERYVEMAQ